jgi:hypothetical protein
MWMARTIYVCSFYADRVRQCHLLQS